MQQVGFRTACISDGSLLHNNARILIRGVNRHEWHDVHGKVRGPRAGPPASALCAPNARTVHPLKPHPSPQAPTPRKHHKTQVCDEEHMIRDITLMKQCNINAMRCSHYPNASRW